MGNRESQAPPPRLLEALRAVVGDDGCLARPEDLFVYESDGLTLHAERPTAVGELINHADTAMYAEKKRRRKRETVVKG